MNRTVHLILSSSVPECLHIFFSIRLFMLPGLLWIITIPAAHAQREAPTQQERELYAQQLMVQAMTQSFLGYYDKAIPLYEEALKATPSSATLNSALAEAYEHLGEYTPALFYAQQALTLEQDNLHFHRHLVHLYILSDDTEQAESQLHALLETFPNDVEALSDLVEIQSLNGNIDQALISQDRLIALRGPDTGLLETRLRLLNVLKDWPAYEETLIDLETLNPDDPLYLKEKGTFYAERNRTQEAIEALKAALSLAPSDQFIARLLAEQYEHSGDPEAARTLENTTTYQVTDPDAAYLYAKSLYDEQKTDEAALEAIEDILRDALVLSPDHVNTLTLLGYVLSERGLYAESASFLKRSLELNPRNINDWISASRAFLLVHNYGEAAELAEEGLLLFPGQLPLLRLSAMANARAHNNATALSRSTQYIELADRVSGAEATDLAGQHAEMLAYAGLLYGRTQEMARADSLFEAALALAPDEPAVIGTIALGLAERTEQLPDALDFARRAVDMSPENPLFMEILGRVYIARDDLTNAEEWLNRAIQADGTSPAAFEFMGDLLLKKGQAREAVASWNRALQLNPDNPTLLEKVKIHAN